MIHSCMIHLTEACNLGCDYCYEKHSSKDISPEVLAKTIDLVFKDDFTVQKQLMLFGGEPLLNIDAIEYCYRRTHEFQQAHDNTNVHIPIMTNGTIYSTRLVDIIHRYCIKTGFQVSLDGIKEAHNEHRKFKTGLGSFDTIIRNIPRYLKEIPHLSVRMTVTPETIKNLYESVKMVVDLGVKHIAFMLVIEYDYNDDDLKCYDEQFQKIADLYVEHFPNVYIDKLDVDYKGRARDKNHPCEAGKSLITVSASGDVYPCHRFYWMNAYKMGNILDDNLVLHEDILNAKVDNMGCKNCPVDRCNRCLAMNYQLNKDVYISPKTGYCKLVGIHDKWAEYVKAKVLANGAYLKKALGELKKCY